MTPATMAKEKASLSEKVAKTFDNSRGASLEHQKAYLSLQCVLLLEALAGGDMTKLMLLGNEIKRSVLAVAALSREKIPTVTIYSGAQA